LNSAIFSKESALHLEDKDEQNNAVLYLHFKNFKTKRTKLPSLAHN